MHIVVIGCGRMGRMRASALAADPDVEQVLLAGRDAGRVAHSAGQIGATPVGLEEAFSTCAEGIVISTVTSSHRDLLQRAIDSRATIFCEKPLTGDLAETESIVADAAAHKVTIQVGYHRRFDPGMVALRDAIRSGEAGTLYTIKMLSHDHQPSPPEFIAGSGGIFRDLHVHDFDLLRWLTGREVDSVVATATVRLHEQYRANDDADTAVTLVQMDDGLVASVSGTRHDPLGYDVRVEVFGSGRSLTAGLSEKTPLEAAWGGLPWIRSQSYKGFLDRFSPAFAAETHAFVELVQGKLDNPCPPSEDVAAMRIAVACERSRREHHATSLHLDQKEANSGQ